MALVVVVNDGVVTPHRMPFVGDLPSSARRALSGVWTYRANAEREAERRFTRLARELRDVDAPSEAVTLAERAIGDERRHAALCAELASTYSGEPTELRPIEEVPLGPKHLCQPDRVLYEVVAFCCITETLNTSLMKVSHDAARVPEVRAALRTILRDEVRHARIGWAHLAAERTRRRGDFLAEMLPKMLASAVKQELFSPGPPPRENEKLVAHGELPEAVRFEIFESSVRDVIAPGFESLGVDTLRMLDWARSMRGLTQPS